MRASKYVKLYKGTLAQCAVVVVEKERKRKNPRHEARIVHKYKTVKLTQHETPPHR
jgi:hypothetical protein